MKGREWSKWQHCLAHVDSVCFEPAATSLQGFPCLRMSDPVPPYKDKHVVTAFFQLHEAKRKEAICKYKRKKHRLEESGILCSLSEVFGNEGRYSNSLGLLVRWLGQRLERWSAWVAFNERILPLIGIHVGL